MPVTLLHVLSRPLFESAVKKPSALCFQMRYWLLLRIPVKLSKFQCGMGITVTMCRFRIMQSTSLVWQRTILPLWPVAASCTRMSENFCLNSAWKLIAIQPSSSLLQLRIISFGSDSSQSVSLSEYYSKQLPKRSSIM